MLCCHCSRAQAGGCSVLPGLLHLPPGLRLSGQGSTETAPVCLSLLVQPQHCLPHWDLSLSQEQPPCGITTAPGPDQAALVLLSLPLLCFVPWTQSCSQGAPHSSSAVKGKEGAWEDTL